MRATDVMTRPVLTVRMDDSIEQAAAELTSRDITAAPVVDPAGDLVGMVSESDLLLRQVAPGRLVRDHPPSLTKRGDGPIVVSDVMSGDVVSLSPDAELAEVAETMLVHDVRSVPIVDDNSQLVGIVSRRDILRAMVRADDNVQREVQQRLDEYAAGEGRWSVTVVDGVATVAGEFADRVEEQVVEALAHTVRGVTEVRLGHTDRPAR